MSSFNDKLKEYYEKLRVHPELVQAINNKKENTARAKLVIFSPSNEAELLVADKVTTFFIDSISLFDQIYDIEVPNFEDVKLLDYYVALIKAFKSGDSSEVVRVKEEVSNIPPEEAGELLFDSFLVLSKGPNEFIDYIQKKSEIEDFEEFISYYEIANGIISSINMSGDIDDVLNEPTSIDTLSRTIDSFHSKYEKAFSKKRTDQKRIVDK